MWKNVICENVISTNRILSFAGLVQQEEDFCIYL